MVGSAYVQNDLLLAAVGAVSCFAGSTSPDWLEIPYGDGRRVITHRTVTHWVVLWLIAGGLALSVPDPWISAAMLGFVVGGLIHLSGDAVTPAGIPWLHPTNKIQLARVPSGGLGEILWVGAIWLVALTLSPVPLVSNQHG